MRLINNRILAVMIAVILSTTVFLSPVTVYANELADDYGDTYEITDFDLDGFDLSALLQMFNISDMFAAMEMFGETEFTAVPAELPDETELSDTKPFTPDGQATVVDLAYEGDGKMFYSFRTPAGNVFYLIIDRERTTDNVYFLSPVTEYDLIALAETAGVPNNTGGTGTSVSAIPNTPTTGNQNNGTDENPEKTDTDPETPPAPRKSGNNGMLIFLLIGAAVVGGAGYYIKIVRPKQQGGMDDDEDDDIPENDEDEIEFEDEAEEFDEDEYEHTADSDIDEDEDEER